MNYNNQLIIAVRSTGFLEDRIENIEDLRTLYGYVYKKYTTKSFRIILGIY